MSSARRVMLLAAAIVVVLLAPAAARAALPDPLGFRLSSAAYTVHENAGAAVITIERTNTAPEAQIRYLTTPGSAVRHQDYQPVKAMIDFLPGQASATFTVRIVDHHMPGLPLTFGVALFGPSPIGLAQPSKAEVTILEDDPVDAVRDPLNPLGLPAQPPASDPLSGAAPFVDVRHSIAGTQAWRWRNSHPRLAGMLDVIAREPQVERYGNWSGRSPGKQVYHYLVRAAREQPSTVPELATYYVVGGHCTGHYSDPPWRQGLYHRWIESLAQGIGQYRAVLFLEMDSLITVGCLSREGLQVRLHELHDAIDILSQVPHLVTYLDAGAADAVPYRQTARMLRAAGVGEIRGFFVNSTHFDWTSKEIRYGERISRLTGAHFVVNTAENGQGPLHPPDRVHHGNEVLCDPQGRGLGPKPTFDTGYPNVDAFAWIAHPGVSGGHCRPGAPGSGHFWPQLALELVRHADFRVR